MERGARKTGEVLGHICSAIWRHLRLPMNTMLRKTRRQPSRKIPVDAWTLGHRSQLHGVEGRGREGFPALCLETCQVGTAWWTGTGCTGSWTELPTAQILPGTACPIRLQSAEPHHMLGTHQAPAYVVLASFSFAHTTGGFVTHI